MRPCLSIQNSTKKYPQAITAGTSTKPLIHAQVPIEKEMEPEKNLYS